MDSCNGDDHDFKPINVVTRVACNHVQSHTLHCSICGRKERVFIKCGCKEDNAKRKR